MMMKMICRVCDVDEGDRSSDDNGGGGSIDDDDGMVMVAAFADGSISFERFVGFVKRRLLHSCGFFGYLFIFLSHSHSPSRSHPHAF